MNIQEKIRQIVESHRVVLFMKGTKQFPQCGFSSRAVQLLSAAGCDDFLSINVLEDNDIRQGIKEYAQWPTIPQLYVDGEFQGGSDVMLQMFEEGELQALVKQRL